MTGRDILLIGASAGGVHAISEVVAALPRDLPAAVFVVLHVSPWGRSALPAILNRSSALPAAHPEDGDPIEPGRVYVAPPDRHLMVEKGRVRLFRGPTENNHRPALDVLFRTAAHAYGPRVIGVVLTGNLDDGTAGLAAVKRQGGLAVAQDPKEADYPSMPASAIQNVRVDHVLPLGEIGPLLARLALEPLPEEAVVPGPGEEDTAMSKDPETEGERISAGEEKASGFTCPACGGALWEKSGELLHFRCRTGHAYSPETLLARQGETLDAALWAAVRALEENAALARRMERRLRERGGNLLTWDRYEKRAQAAEQHADVLRRLLHEDKPIAREE